MNRMLHALASYIAIFLVSVLSIGQNLNAIAVHSDWDGGSAEQLSSTLSSAHAFQLQAFPGLLSLIEPSLEDSEEQEEDAPHSTLFRSKAIQTPLHSSWTSVAQFLDAVQDRQAVSLYVLHHAWRSFLS